MSKEIEGFELEPDVLGTEEVEEYSYEKCIALPCRELSSLCRLIEPLTKSSIDEFGKSVYFTCVDDDFVQVKYYNNPYVVISTIPNASRKRVKDFAILVSTLKNLLSNSFASIVFVEQGDEIDLAFGEQLLYLETKNLRKEAYVFEPKEAENTITYELANYVFKTVGSILSQTERASEKVIVVKDGTATFNTGVFAASIKSPFSGEEPMVIYKQVSDAIATLTDVNKGDLKYGVDTVLTVKSDTFYCEFPVGLGDKIKAFISPSTQLALGFEANVKVSDESLYGLVKLVQSLDYLSDTVKVEFVGDEMVVYLFTQNNSRTFPYKFKVLEGHPEESGSMSITIGVLKVFLDIVGDDVKYAFNGMGLGIKNEIGSFLIRKV